MKDKLALQSIDILGEKLLLTNQRVLFWEKESALILSDLHIGKSAHFRKNGIAIPKNTLVKDVQRLQFLMNEFEAKKIIINGDLLHAGENSDVDDFCDWKSGQQIEFHLVKGNHDRISEKLRHKLNLDSESEKLETEKFLIVHEYREEIEKFQITGHIHPGIILKLPVKKLRLPCFAVTSNQLLLPAYSEFTGLDTKNTPKDARFFAFTDKEIHEV